MASELVNVIVAFAFIYLLVRWFSKGNDNARADSPAAILGFSPRKATDDMIATVHAAFPDIPRANIHYDLLKTGSAEVTSNKILERGVLDAPPAAYFRAFPLATQQAAQGQPTAVSSTPTPAQPRDLISRFQLEQRVAQPEPAAGATAVRASWDASAEKREASLRERKAQMILEARKRMAEKLQAQTAGSS
ncbi:hypothetical protein EXIGLDRAFT_643137 [Exidia glandulosa HHB12029]|uniref:CUE domain-containing protein n=1 Tax=Exidia glandulosa HHB12029 TaxID=1314781 RepID=A0A165KI99_EXIGL|nr:hypothetical protein EXIGLDRAFT_643137 [Exidia glandulosa HHB12029]